MANARAIARRPAARFCQSRHGRQGTGVGAVFGQSPEKRLGRADKPNPDPDGCKNDKGREALDEFVVAGCNVRGVFQAVGEPLDAVAQPVDGLVDGVLYFPVRLGRNEGFAPVVDNFHSIAVVAFVAEQLLRIAISLPALALGMQ